MANWIKTLFKECTAVRCMSAIRTYHSYDLVADMDFAQCNKVVSFKVVSSRMNTQNLWKKIRRCCTQLFQCMQMYAILHIRPCCIFLKQPCCSDRTSLKVTIYTTQKKLKVNFSILLKRVKGNVLIIFASMSSLVWTSFWGYMTFFIRVIN